MIDEKKKTAKTETETERDYLPAATIYHGNYRNTGSAMAQRVKAATVKQTGYMQLEIARQLEAGDKNKNTFHRFDWGNRITLRFTFVECGEILGVLRGNAESLRDGAGIIHKAAKFTMRHMVDPIPGYELKAIVTKDGKDAAVSIMLSMEEGYAIGAAIAAAMGKIAFGC